MTKRLQIVRVDNDLVQKANLQIGNNIIGRGAATGCNDGQVLKHAVTINLSPDDEMTITPVVPCYMKSAGCARWKSLKVGSSTQIKPGDVCSLLPDKCWFKIISVPDIMTEIDQTLKRKVEEDLSNETNEKKMCVSSSTKTVVSPSEALKDILNDKDQPPTEHQNLFNNENKEHNDAPMLQEIYFASSSERSEVPTMSSKISTDAQDTAELSVQIDGKRKAENSNLTSDTTDAESGKKTKWDRDFHNSDQTEAASPIKKSPRLSARQEDRTPSADRVPRDKCMYGSRCYRKNHNHKNNYSHPGDRDYDEIDDREECPYGVKCYRKNPQHKTQFKHTTIPRQRRKATVSAAVNTNQKLDESSSTEESVDESDYQPSDYMESSDWEEDSGSEWEDGTTG
ncbi:aprataxin and PNK-like factor isoform X2 [Pseudomyrmex gracilis]|uniref:aprataxin and PNK-like factor isoform X2 n=1 Tax=Pseudomyrmex gracilis TaxID=219809 RepID=UPI0009950BC8|nr:aprataxin and PNK-like factor isoform X2 [Pseudomyrmex gracilis]